jgi:hypothetical protein
MNGLWLLKMKINLYTIVTLLVAHAQILLYHLACLHMYMMRGTQAAYNGIEDGLLTD